MSGDASRSTRRQLMDFMKLKNSSRRVYPSDTVSEFWVEFTGPEGTAYEEGTWMLHVVLPREYPFKSPSIGFANRILHPNVDEESGSVCLDVINQKWTPMFELQNIFDIFLPQLLRYPNPDDPLNPNAAAQLQRDPVNYYSLLQAHVARYATLECALAAIPESFRPSHVAATASAGTEAGAATAATTMTSDARDGDGRTACANGGSHASPALVSRCNGSTSNGGSSCSGASDDSTGGNGHADWSTSHGVGSGGLTTTTTTATAADDDDDDAYRNGAHAADNDRDADEYVPEEIEL